MITAEQGRMAEDLSARILARKGLIVVNQQLELPDNFPLTGHIDGEIEGTKAGFEHKLMGRYNYTGVLKDGIEVAAPGYMVQAVSYGKALGWENVLFVLLSQDASAVRGDATANKRAKNPARRWAELEHNAKVTILDLDLRSYYRVFWPTIEKRARELAGGRPAKDVIREHDPELVDREGQPKFPCGWCQWYTKCKEDGPGKFRVTELPVMK